MECKPDDGRLLRILHCERSSLSRAAVETTHMPSSKLENYFGVSKWIHKFWFGTICDLYQSIPLVLLSFHQLSTLQVEPAYLQILYPQIWLNMGYQDLHSVNLNLLRVAEAVLQMAFCSLQKPYTTACTLCRFQNFEKVENENWK